MAAWRWTLIIIITIIIGIITIIIIMLSDECGSMEVETEFKIFNQNATFVHHEVCKLLLNKNAFVNSKTKLGWTALHFAANKVRNFFLFKNIKSTFNCPQGYTDLVEFLIKSGGTIGLKRTTTY